MEKSDTMEEVINEQLVKIEEFLSHDKEPIVINVALEPSATREHHRIQLHVVTPHHDFMETYEHQGIPFYEAVAKAVDAMYYKLHKEKERLVDERKWIGRHEEFKKQR
jgi:ribosome-associated translation inhibitor RaiA